MDWINLTKDRDGWRAVVDVIMKFLVPKNAGNLLTDSPLISQERLSCMNFISYLVS